jgi:type II secretory pathway predicted ATPase ExeA
MYKEFYGLTAYPFALTADPEFFYPSENHGNCLRHLLYSLERGQGLLVVTGEIGTGKTLLLNTLVQNLGKKTHVAFLVHSKLDSLDILQYVFQEFGLETSGKSQTELLIHLKNFLLPCVMVNEKFVLIIDEAQNLSADVLEDLRLLINFEKSGKRLLQIILAGQPQLENILKLPELTQLMQRIGLKYRLLPLNYAETRCYIERRLAVSGATYSIFTESAVEEIFIHSQGIPRVINLICDLAFFLGFSAEKREIGPIIIKLAVKELNLSVPEKPRSYRIMHCSRRALVTGLVTFSLFGVGVVLQSPLMSRQPGEYPAASVPGPLAVSPQRPVFRDQPILPHIQEFRDQPILPISAGLSEPPQRVQWKQTTVSYHLPADQPFVVSLPPLQYTPDTLAITVTLEAAGQTPRWLTLEPATLTLRGLAPPTTTGKTYHLTVRAQTADGLASLLELTLTMIARRPMLGH